jgi:hypothetical protein
MQITTKSLIAVIVGITVTPLIIIALVVVVAKIALIFNPLPPTIKHGEFPFHLKYEMNGKTYDVNDTVVCDFDRIAVVSESIVKKRMWEEHLKSGTSRITILSENNVRSVVKPNRIDTKIEIYYNYGSATFFMGDPSGSLSEKPQIKYIETYSERPNVTVIDATPFTAEQLQKNFGIKIISLNYSPPIKNTFK